MATAPKFCDNFKCISCSLLENGGFDPFASANKILGSSMEGTFKKQGEFLESICKTSIKSNDSFTTNSILPQIDLGQEIRNIGSI